jgi:tRNA threonylcarbamoyl adenosine modification protein YeaZ
MTRNSQPLLLAVDTSGDICSVAALRGSELMSEHTFRHGMHLSEHLMSHVDTVLHEAAADLNAVSGFAVGIGPGSFTGTRIGVMTAKTLAVVRERPLFGIGGLQALALELAGVQETVVPILPCRTGVVFAGAYQVVDGWPVELIPPAAWSITELAGELKFGNHVGIVFCGEAVPRYRDDIVSLLPASSFHEQRPIQFGIGRSPRASLVGALAWQRWLTGDFGDDALAVVPLYISPPPITMPKSANSVQTPKP